MAFALGARFPITAPVVKDLRAAREPRSLLPPRRDDCGDESLHCRRTERAVVTGFHLSSLLAFKSMSVTPPQGPRYWRLASVALGRRNVARTRRRLALLRCAQHLCLALGDKEELEKRGARDSSLALLTQGAGTALVHRRLCSARGAFAAALAVQEATGGLDPPRSLDAVCCAPSVRHSSRNTPGSAPADSDAWPPR
ncbi:hypothetical protein MRX96_009820 [Rhipicephalus microplus]